MSSALSPLSRRLSMALMLRAFLYAFTVRRVSGVAGVTSVSMMKNEIVQLPRPAKCRVVRGCPISRPRRHTKSKAAARLRRRRGGAQAAGWRASNTLTVCDNRAPQRAGLWGRRMPAFWRADVFAQRPRARGREVAGRRNEALPETGARVATVSRRSAVRTRPRLPAHAPSCLNVFRASRCRAAQRKLSGVLRRDFVRVAQNYRRCCAAVFLL